MPKIVACPKCGKKYKLPDSFNAKRVRCQACGADFAAQYDVSQLNETMDGGSDLQPQPTAKRPSQQRPSQQRPPKQRPPQQPSAQPTGRAPKPAAGASQDSLAQMGLSRIKQQPDLFGDDQSAGPDPLRNHVVQDPGFGNANAPGHANQNQGQSGSPAGDLDDVVSNPFMSDTGSGSVNAMRKKALKRKEENELLAGYKTSSNSLNNARRPSELSENGIKRTGFWVAHFIFNIVCSIIGQVSEAAQKMQMGGENAEPISRESAMALGFLGLLAVLAVFVVLGFFFATTTSLRFQNIRFKNPLWKKIATGIAAAPWVIWAVMMLVVVVLSLSKMLALFYVVGVLAIAGLLALTPSVVVQTLALALPPDFGIHKKLDVPAYIWLGLAVLPLLLLIFVSGYFALYATGRFFG